MKMLLGAVMLFGGHLLGCSCFPSGTPCSGLSGDRVVFIGRVLGNGGAGFGSGPSRVLVEEGLHNAPQAETELVIGTGEGTSCYIQLKVGERYVFYAHKNARADGPVLWTGTCSGTFLVTGNDAVVEALRNAARGGPARILGSVRRSADYRAVAGANVVVRSETNRYVVSTDRDGRYEIRGVVPGSYRIEVTQPGYERDPTYKKFSGSSLFAVGRIAGQNSPARGE